MATTRVFSGIPRSDAEKLKNCLRAESKAYMQGEEILTITGERLSTIGCVAQGSVLVYYEISGERYLLDTLFFGDAFGELYYLPSSGDKYIIVAETDCEIIYIGYASVITPCNENCYYHLTLIDNLFRIGAEKARKKELHLCIMKGKKTRDKIMAYLKSLQNIYKSNVFDVPLSQTELAEYLSVDRSAMARELSLMKKEGLIYFKGRHCEILTSDPY